ncbi:MAG: hypothetical protein KDK25_08660 [Leptospiraceae bacterium]|nr:hypothetical protein [Leptospiraceae bacterium]MCB1169387.1 hypothetical protein [Leptospiraceae bacterium]MCB1170391.1 hypothetical protein [Leptospiraceae bacterium]
MEKEKLISMPIKDLAQLKIVLATWYSFLKDQAGNLSQEAFASSLKTPVLYDLEKDQVEVLFTGSQELLKQFSDYVFQTSDSSDSSDS